MKLLRFMRMACGSCGLVKTHHNMMRPNKATTSNTWQTRIFRPSLHSFWQIKLQSRQRITSSNVFTNWLTLPLTLQAKTDDVLSESCLDVWDVWRDEGELTERVWGASLRGVDHGRGILMG